MRFQWYFDNLNRKCPRFQKFQKSCHLNLEAHTALPSLVAYLTEELLLPTNHQFLRITGCVRKRMRKWLSTIFQGTAVIGSYQHLSRTGCLCLGAEGVQLYNPSVLLRKHLLMEMLRQSGCGGHTLYAHSETELQYHLVIHVVFWAYYSCIVFSDLDRRVQ